MVQLTAPPPDALPGLRYCKPGTVRCFKAWDLSGTKYEWCYEHGERCEIKNITGTPPPPGVGAARPKQLSPTQTRALQLAETKRKMYGHDHTCAPSCGCKDVPPVIRHPNGNGSSIPLQPAPGTGQGLCWGVAGAQVLGLAPGSPVDLDITVEQYSWLRARKLTITAVDPATGTPQESLVRVNTVSAVGRQVIGSNAGISGQAIASRSDNALMFGADVPAITSSNRIRVNVTNNAAVPINVSADVEGVAAQ